MHPPALSPRLRRTHLPQWKTLPEYAALKDSADANVPNWAGVIETANQPYSAASASWTLPNFATSTSSYVLIWVGFDGGGSQSLIIEQAGFLGFNTGGGSPTVSWSTWVEPYPAGEEFLNSTSYPAATGDNVSVSMTYNTATQYEAVGPAGEFSCTMANSTKSWSYTISKSVRALNIEENISSRLAPQSVEFIVESGNGVIGDFGTLTFNSIATTPTMTAPSYLTMKPGATADVTPGTISGNSLTLTWHAYT